MYGKKFKQLRKKSKSGVGNPKTSWGPRVALEEREQEESVYYGKQQLQHPGGAKGIFRNPHANGSGLIYQSNSKLLLQSRNVACSKSNDSKQQDLNKPLSVIIPSTSTAILSDKYDYAYNNKNGNDTHQPHQRNRFHNKYTTDSLPSTETWHSSGSEENDENNNNSNKKKNGQSKSYDVSEQMKSVSETHFYKDLETIEVIVPTNMIQSTNPGNHNNEAQAQQQQENRKISSSRTSTSSSTSSSKSSASSCSGKSLASRGHNNIIKTPAKLNGSVGLVYVPMEQATSKPKLLNGENGTLIHTNEHRRGGHDDDETFVEEMQSTILNGSIQPKDSSDVDSLLESFDSVIFKPKCSSPINNNPYVNNVPNSSGLGINIQIGNSSSHNNGCGGGNKYEEVLHRKTVQPADDTNSSKSSKATCSNNNNKKSLRFSDLLDIKFSSPTPNKCNSPKQSSFDAESSRFSGFSTATMLSCGHLNVQDNYSTLSSISSETDFSNNNHEEITKSNEIAENQEKSALQQLRDLSILIGGSFHNNTTDEEVLHQNPPHNKSSPNSDDFESSKLRKCSTSTDSGKGSGSGMGTITEQTLTSECNVSSKNSVCSCEDNCIFRPECQDCMNFFKNPFESMPLIEPLENHYGEQLVEKKRSKKKQKFIKNPKAKIKLLKAPVPACSMALNCCDLAQCDCYNGGSVKNLWSNTGTKADLILSNKRKNMLHKNDGPTANNNGHSSSSSPGSSSSIDANLFTIAEEDERYEYGVLRQQNCIDNQELNLDQKRVNHSHPNCWLSTDATMGWSDLESLYSQNLKSENPVEVNGECLKCWSELLDIKHQSNTNSTVDRTKRMFIWLNKRPKEFNAPWWEAKKQASIKWLVTKALSHLNKHSNHLVPFRESKKDKTKMRLKEDIIAGLVSGKLYTMVLSNLFYKTRSDPELYAELNRNLRKGGKLTLWEIIKILSRKGVYVAQPSDMKLTEGTLRQRKPLRIAAHIALIEAIMGLYAKELLCRERVTTILNSFGHTLRPEAQSAEELVISWINTAISTLKTYILNNNLNDSGSGRIQRWLKITSINDIRDLSDGVGISSLLALYFSNDVSLDDISLPEEIGETLNIYDIISNHTRIQRFCNEFFPEKIYHLCVTDFLYVHGYMKQNILAFLVDLFIHLEVNPIVRVNRLTHLPLRVQL